MSELYVDDILKQPIDSNLSVYAPPEGLTDLMDRKEGNKQLILYVGEKALLDVLIVDAEGKPVTLLTRLEDSPDQALDLFEYPQRHADEKVARNVFDKQWLTDEEINQIVGLREAA